MPRFLMLVAAAAAIALLGFLAFRFFQPQIGGFIYERTVERNVFNDRAAALGDGLHVFICGAGSPMPDPARAGPCTAVMTPEHAFIIDAGSGAIGNLTRMGYPMSRIDGVLLTHLHSDHIDGLGELMLQAWINGSRTAPLPLHGPESIDDVVDGFNQAYRIDSTYRLAHHGPEIANMAGAGGIAFPISLQDGRGMVFDDGVMTITAFTVSHDPAEPAVGYRIDYRGRSVTISGDTIYSDNLVGIAQQTDILIHDALNVDLVEILRSANARAGRDHIATVLFDIQDYHASPVDAARAASDAGAGALVLSHIVPPLPSPLLYPRFLEGAGEAYSGPITIAEDGMIFSLPAGSDEIHQHGGFGF